MPPKLTSRRSNNNATSPTDNNDAAEANDGDLDISAHDMVVASSLDSEQETSFAMDAIAQWVYYRVLVDNIAGVPSYIASIARSACNFGGDDLLF